MINLSSFGTKCFFGIKRWSREGGEGGKPKETFEQNRLTDRIESYHDSSSRYHGAEEETDKLHGHLQVK